MGSPMVRNRFPELGDGVLKDRVVFDPSRREVYVSGTTIRVEYILNLLTAGLTPAQILDEHRDLTAADIDACLLVGSGTTKVPHGRLTNDRAGCTEKALSSNPQWVTLLLPDFSRKPPVVYRLTSPVVPEAARARMSTWVRSRCMQGPDAAKDALEQRWQDIADSALIRVRQLVMHFEPQAIMLHDQRSWLVCNNEENLGCKLFLVPAPPDKKLVDEHVEARFGDHALLKEFYLHFLGLKDMPPSYACEFTLPTDAIQESWGEDYLRPQFRAEWNSAQSILRTSCGDELLITASGKLGWFFA
jgi:uncharacterized protein (DUF433 family)